jgi:hypothetical protein
MKIVLYRASHGYATWRESTLNTVDGILYRKKTLFEFKKIIYTAFIDI